MKTWKMRQEEEEIRQISPSQQAAKRLTAPVITQNIPSSINQECATWVTEMLILDI